MTHSVRAVSRSSPLDPAPVALAATHTVRKKLELAVTRRELLQRAGLMAAAGVATMALKTWPFTGSGTSDAAAQAASSLHVPEYARFMDLVGTTFVAMSGAQRAGLTLEEVVLLGEANDPGRPTNLREVPYALRFIVSAGELARSGIFRLESADQEPVSVFIHQVGMRTPGAGIRYEAVFN